MKRLVAWAIVALLGIGNAAHAHAGPRWFVGGGPTGTADFGFKGGWGGVLGMKIPVSPGAFLVRLEGNAVPSTLTTSWGPIAWAPASPLSLGESGRGSKDATLLSVMAGLRLQSRSPVRPYLDALIGVGYMNDPANTEPVPIYPGGPKGASASHANVALSLGPGVEIQALAGVALFADVHYDFYYVKGATTPVIPVRVGIVAP